MAIGGEHSAYPRNAQFVLVSDMNVFDGNLHIIDDFSHEAFKYTLSALVIIGIQILAGFLENFGILQPLLL